MSIDSIVQETPKTRPRRLSPATGLVLFTTSIVAGGYHGFCDAKGIPVEPAELELALTYGPAAVRAAVSGIGGMVSAGKGNSSPGLWRGSGKRNVAGGAGGAVIGATVGAMVGGVQTLAGYGLVYGVARGVGYVIARFGQ